MTDGQIVDLFCDVADLLSELQGELSVITTSDTGSDPTRCIQRGIESLRTKLAELSAQPHGNADIKSKIADLQREAFSAAPSPRIPKRPTPSSHNPPIPPHKKKGSL